MSKWFVCFFHFKSCCSKLHATHSLCHWKSSRETTPYSFRGDNPKYPGAQELMVPNISVKFGCCTSSNFRVMSETKCMSWKSPRAIIRLSFGGDDAKNPDAQQLMVVNISMKFNCYTSSGFRVTRNIKFVIFKVIKSNNSIIIWGRQSKIPRCTTTRGGEHICDVWWLYLVPFMSCAWHKFLHR